jgi:hypothetical protein
VHRDGHTSSCSPARERFVLLVRDHALRDESARVSVRGRRSVCAKVAARARPSKETEGRCTHPPSPDDIVEERGRASSDEVQSLALFRGGRALATTDTAESADAQRGTTARPHRRAPRADGVEAAFVSKEQK